MQIAPPHEVIAVSAAERPRGRLAQFGPSGLLGLAVIAFWALAALFGPALLSRTGDRKSTRLNSSHTVISYAVFWLKKKNVSRRCEILNATVRAPVLVI